MLIISTNSATLIVSKKLKTLNEFPFHNILISHTVDFILEMGVDAAGDYVIPEECPVGQGIIQQQLRIIKKNQSEDKEENVSKVQKINDEGGKQILKPMTDIAVSKCDSPEHKKSVSNDEEMKKILEKPATVAVSSQSLADFFKERRQAFAAKDPKQMEAPPAPQPLKPKVNDIPVIPSKIKDFFPLVLPRGHMAEKLRKSAPYNMFLTAVSASSRTHNDPSFVSFLDLLDPSLGELESSVQINFTVSIAWLFAQYTVAEVNDLPLVILYGQEEEQLRNVNHIFPNIQSFMIQVPADYGCHHAKVMLFFYKDKSMRVVVSTANLYKDDWDNRVQGLWISERLPAIEPGSKDGESVTNFRKDLVAFLENYHNQSLQQYINRIKKSDFSSVKVFLVTSIPGAHKGDTYGHPRLGSLLKKHSAPIDVKHSVIMQSSSLGNYGNSATAYLTGEVLRSFKMNSGPVGVQASPTIKLIYPSLANVQNSHDGILGGGCLPYHQAAQNRQPWLNQHLYQWKSESRNCDRAMPHIKSYCRYSNEGLYWFGLMSHNVSKSAWGVTKKMNQREWALNINSYEAGVVFFPRILLDGQDTFPMNEAQQRNETPIFKLPYDLPPIPYEPNDAPFCIEYMQEMLEAMAMM
jgi:tyrosyl-DNA phosphodiesterase 1